MQKDPTLCAGSFLHLLMRKSYSPCFVPHSLQNFEPAGSAAPHFTQEIVCAPVSILAPHSVQNFALVRFAAPHFGQANFWPPALSFFDWFIALVIAPAIALP